MNKVKATIVYAKYSELPLGINDTHYKSVELEIPDGELAPKITSIGIEDITVDGNSDRSVKFPRFQEPIYDHKDIDRLTGKLMTYIDATYQDVEQRKAHKDIARQIVWDWQLNLHRRAEEEQEWARNQ